MIFLQRWAFGDSLCPTFVLDWGCARKPTGGAYHAPLDLLFGWVDTLPTVSPFRRKRRLKTCRLWRFVPNVSF